jgi:hypothetical protein
VIILSCLLLLPLAAPAQTEWLEFNAGTQGQTSLLIQYNGTWDDLLTFDVEVRGLLADTVEVDSVEYLRFNRSSGLTVSDSTGYPELPVARCFVWVPDHTDLTLSWAANCPEKRSSLPVYPAPLDSLREDSTSTPFIDEFFRKDSSAYSSEQWYPDTLARLVGTFHLRDTRVAIVDVYPMQYLASDDSIRVWSDIEVALEFDDHGYDWSTADLGPYERLIGDRLLGYRPSWDYSPMQTGNVYRLESGELEQGPPEVPEYVILAGALNSGVTIDGQWVDDFAEYRAQRNGFDVAIVNAHDVYTDYNQGEDFLTAELIRDFTEDMWDWGEPGERPQYLLLLGDHSDYGCTTIGPWFLRTHEPPGDPAGIANDEWYVYFDEPREVLYAMPDMMVGRLPARDAEELQDMLDLIVAYEAEAGEPPYPPDLTYRRYITRLAGNDHYTYDNWKPSPGWTDSLRQWMGYSWDNYYCGDGEDNGYFPPNPDGSRMTSAEWRDTCISLFERGSQVAFYSNHGAIHLFSAGLNWEEGGPPHFGAPDSTFDDLEVKELSSPHHWPPFVLMLCCSSGSFSHTASEHPTGAYPGLCQGYKPPDSTWYDFDTSCLAEEFMSNTDCGAIGVFAGSNSSEIACYNRYGKGILGSIYHRGITRLGEAIQAGRLEYLSEFFGSSAWKASLGQFNLLGDPAVDIGDRMKFPDKCELIISPADLQASRYPTRNIGSDAEVELYVTVRNAGGSASEPFDVDLSITSPGQPMVLLTERCSGLDPGEEETLAFTWSTSWNPPGTVGLSAEADPEEECDDSWRGNNTAEVDVEMLDFYPNEDGWPVQVSGSVVSVPALGDLDSDGDLDIVAIHGMWLSVYDPESPDEAEWQVGPYIFSDSLAVTVGYSVPAIADMNNDHAPEVIVDSREALLVFDGSSGNLEYSYSHPSLGAHLGRGPHSPIVADINSDVPGNEIALVCGDSDKDDLHLFILGIADGDLSVLDKAELRDAYFSYSREWICAGNLTEDLSQEAVVAYSSYESGGMGYFSGLWVYDRDDDTGASGFIDSMIVDESENTAGIPAIGELAGDLEIANSRQYSNSAHPPAYIIDSSLEIEANCAYNPSRESENVLCCMMADWDPLIPGLDRIIAPAENQCFVWSHLGEEAWFAEYNNLTGPRPPFGALGNLDGDARDTELIVASRAGVVYAYDSDGNELLALGFPYTLPSEVYGGFVIADIDNDEKVEVVFGTMDNYLHLWELGSCDEGYAPWPQCQHDAQRTGVLE